MPATTNVTALSKKMAGMFGADHSKAARDTSTPDFNASLPEGIENGVAQIISCSVGEVKAGGKMAGQPYFMMRAAVRHPKTHNGMSIEGRQDGMLEMLCDTPDRQSRKTRAEHLEYVYSYLRLWGVDTSKGAGLTGEKAFQWFMSVLAALGQAKPLVEFRTWKGQATSQYPNPRVNVSWGGLAKLAQDDEVPADGVQDDSGDTPADEADTTDTSGADEGTQGGDEAANELPDDPDELAALADPPENNAEAAEKLADMADAAGIDNEAQGRAPTYAVLAEWIKAGGEPQEAAALKVGDLVKYKPPAGPGKKAVVVECEVKKLYKNKAGADVADLLNNVNKRDKYPAVLLEKLEAV